MSFGASIEPAAVLALALAAALMAGARLGILSAPRLKWVVWCSALTAAGLSAAYVAYYLRGGPRIIDATSYYLQARALAHGLVTWPAGEPAASTLGRFLVAQSDAAPTKVAVIFPPGWPAVLAVGFLAHAPLAVGPLLAGAIVLATAALTSRVSRGSLSEESRRLAVGLAAVFSALCAALRYHTADTMSHGLAALLVTVAYASALRAVDRGSARSGLAAGIAAGWLVLTRPVSGAALALGLLFVLAGRSPDRGRLRLGLAVAAGIVPCLLLLVAEQSLATGRLGLSTQSLYYAVSDGPAGCFRYGFGAGIGCLGEHGDFVRSRLPDGYGLAAALGTTLRRSWMHLLDPLNAEPLALLVIAGGVIAWRRRRARSLVIGISLQLVAYIPFYFDGNYPGGGARFYADILPLEHVLAALAAVGLVRGRVGRARAVVLAAFPALMLAGFGLRASSGHAALRDREGGLPMFEPARLAAAGVREGMLFIGTDHGFNLAAAPEGGALDVVRLRGDGLDRLAWEARGRPAAFRYDFVVPSLDAGPSPSPLASVRVVPMRFQHADTLVIEGESLWPSLAQGGAFALPEYASGTCASAGRLLRIRPDRLPSARPHVDIALPARALRGARITPWLAVGPGVGATIEWLESGPGARGEVPAARGQEAQVACVAAPAHEVPGDADVLTLRVSVGDDTSGLLALDRLEVRGRAGLNTE